MRSLRKIVQREKVDGFEKLRLVRKFQATSKFTIARSIITRRSYFKATLIRTVYVSVRYTRVRVCERSRLGEKVEYKRQASRERSRMCENTVSQPYGDTVLSKRANLET